jgi:hypothetical protein
VGRSGCEDETGSRISAKKKSRRQFPGCAGRARRTMDRPGGYPTELADGAVGRGPQRVVHAGICWHEGRIGWQRFERGTGGNGVKFGGRAVIGGMLLSGHAVPLAGEPGMKPAAVRSLAAGVIGAGGRVGAASSNYIACYLAGVGGDRVRIFGRRTFGRLACRWEALGLRTCWRRATECHRLACCNTQRAATAQGT